MTGIPEIFTTDMLPGDNYRLKTTMAFDPYHLEDMKYRANYHYQITQNCLHLNDGHADFSRDSTCYQEWRPRTGAGAP